MYENSITSCKYYSFGNTSAKKNKMSIYFGSCVEIKWSFLHGYTLILNYLPSLLIHT